MSRQPDAEAHADAQPYPGSTPDAAGASAVVDENELALRELGEDDLDDDPVLPSRFARAEVAAENDRGPVPLPTVPLPTEPPVPEPPAERAAHSGPVQRPGPAEHAAEHREPAEHPERIEHAQQRERAAVGAGAVPAAAEKPRRPRRPAPQLPTSALVHTPTAAQAGGGDSLTPAARAQIERNSRSSPRRTMGVVALIALVAASVFGIRALGAGEQPEMPPVAGEQSDPAAGDPAAGEPAPADPQAVEELEAKLEDDPTNTGTMNSLADLHLASGDYASAQAVRERMVELDPSDVDSLMMLGVTAFNAGDGRTAEESWKTAIEVQPENPEAYYNLGFVYMASDRAEDARAAWEQVRELAPGSSIATTVQQHLDMLENQSGGQ